MSSCQFFSEINSTSGTPYIREKSSLSECCNKKSLNVSIPCCSKLDEDNLYMAYADIMAKVPATGYQY